MSATAPVEAEPVEPTPFDQHDPGFIADPYPVFQTLRQRSQIHPHPTLGLPVAVSHPACAAILRHRQLRRVWSDVAPVSEFSQFNALHRNNMLSNGEQHDRLRGALSHLFTRQRVRRLRGMVQQIATERVTELRERIAEQGSACLMHHVAEPLPTDVITRVLGFPVSDRTQLRTWSNAIVKMYEFGISQPARRAAEHASEEFTGYVRDLVRHRRAHPSEDVLSELVGQLDHQVSRLNGDELIANYILLLMAGHEATVNGIGNAVAALHDNPDQWNLLRTELVGDFAALETAADELLRYDTPNQLFERTAVTTVDLFGQRIRAGEKIAVLLGAANRDPQVFTAAEALDLTRTPNPHLALGVGAHYCLGAPLARMELATTLFVLATELPRLALAGEAVRRPEFVIRGFASLPITES